jgi:hypothetical protein
MRRAGATAVSELKVAQPSFPLAGQGTPLPPNCGFDGEWLLKNVLFLYWPEDQTIMDDTEMNVGFQNSDGKWSFGINAIQLARTCGTTSEQLFEANRAGTLLLVKIEGGATLDAPAKRYTFRVGDHEAQIIISAGRPSGTA